MTELSSGIRFSPEIEEALTSVLPSHDPFDSPDFDPVDYLNKQFPNERSIDNLGFFVSEIQAKLRETETNLMEAVKVQATTANTAARDLDLAKCAVLELHTRVTDIKSRAEESERMVQSISESIKELDRAKNNLSESLKTMKSLQLYMLALQHLATASEKSNYPDCNNCLRDAQAHCARFAKYENDIPKIAELRDKLRYLERELGRLILSDIERHLKSSKDDDAGGEVREACLIADALGEEVWKKIRTNFINSQLEAYGTLFRRGTDDARLERTERRFAYIRKILEMRQRLFTYVFPAHWCVPQELVTEFCLRTRKDIEMQLVTEADDLQENMALLVYILKKTIEAEKDLTQRLRFLKAEVEAAQMHQSSDETDPSSPSRQPTPDYKFYGMIVRCFDQHMGQYVLHEEKMMRRTVEQLLSQDTIVENLLTLQSSQDLFLFIQESMRRAATFAQSQTLAELAEVWYKNLNAYAEALKTKAAVNAPDTPAAEAYACVVVNSADYCRSAAAGLWGDLRQQLEGEADTLEPKSEAVIEAFSELTSDVNTMLVEGICQSLQVHLSDMHSALSNSSDASALDESAPIVALRRRLHSHLYNCARHLLPHCFPGCLNSLAKKFAANYLAPAVYLLKLNTAAPTSVNFVREGNAVADLIISQLRIDVAALEKAFLQQPNQLLQQGAKAPPPAEAVKVSEGGVLSLLQTSPVPSRASALCSGSKGITLVAYIKTVRREFAHLISSLKVLQMTGVGEPFIDLYVQLIPKDDRSLAHCGRLLELKGVKREDMRQWMALLKKRDVAATTPRDTAAGLIGKNTGSSASGVFSARLGEVFSSHKDRDHTGEGDTNASPTTGRMNRLPFSFPSRGSGGDKDDHNEEDTAAMLRKKFTAFTDRLKK